MQINDFNYPPSRALYEQVLKAFKTRDDNLSFSAWCRQNGKSVSNVKNAICGSWDGDKAKAIRHKAIADSGLRSTDLITRIEELAGKSIATKIHNEFSGKSVYIPKQRAEGIANV